MAERRSDRFGLAVTLLVGAVIGVLSLLAVRLVAQPEAGHSVHYHANWAVFLEGERLDLTAGRYMEDVFQCSMDAAHQHAEHRVHMHENNHDVVHVHDSGVTWGHLLANLGFGIGDDYLETGTAFLRSAPDRSLKFILNGRPVRSIRNLEIASEDRLLISYGPETVDEVLATQFPEVQSNADRYNLMPDPASCSGAQEEGFSSRLRRALWY